MCDGDADCFDESDEQDCKPKTSTCDAGSQQACVDGNGCVDLDVVCDGHDDCKDGSDERNCSSIKKREN